MEQQPSAKGRVRMASIDAVLTGQTILEMAAKLCIQEVSENLALSKWHSWKNFVVRMPRICSYARIRSRK